MRKQEFYENDKAKLDLINRMVEKSLQSETLAEKEDFYRSSFENAKDFSLGDLLEDSMNTKNDSSSNNTNQKLPVLRPFETVDFEALTQGFEAEEVKEGTLVLYITEAQLLQLLNQRAIIIPDKKKILSSINTNNEHQRMSLVDDRIKENLGRASPVNKVELIIENKPTSYINQSQDRIINLEPFEQLETSIEYETNMPLVRPNLPETTIQEILNASSNEINQERSSLGGSVSSKIAPDVHVQSYNTTTAYTDESRLNDLIGGLQKFFYRSNIVKSMC